MCLRTNFEFSVSQILIFHLFNLWKLNFSQFAPRKTRNFSQKFICHLDHDNTGALPVCCFIVLRCLPPGWFYYTVVTLLIAYFTRIIIA